MRKHLNSLLLLISLWGSFSVFAQESEAQLRSKADNLFQNQDLINSILKGLRILEKKYYLLAEY